MKKIKLFSLLLCLILLFQCVCIPALASETVPTQLPQVTEAASTALQEPEKLTFGTVCVQNGCRTIEGKKAIGGNDRRLETAQSAFLYEISSDRPCQRSGKTGVTTCFGKNYRVACIEIAHKAVLTALIRKIYKLVIIEQIGIALDTLQEYVVRNISCGREDLCLALCCLSIRFNNMDISVRGVYYAAIRNGNCHVIDAGLLVVNSLIGQSGDSYAIRTDFALILFCACQSQ